jgi:hypothetical protein
MDKQRKKRTDCHKRLSNGRRWLSQIILFLILIRRASFFHILNIGIRSFSSSSSPTFPIVFIGLNHLCLDRSRSRLDTSLHQNSGSHLLRIGWRWKITSLPRLVIDSFDHDKVVPVNLSIRDTFTFSFFFLPTFFLLNVSNPTNSVVGLLFDESLFLRLFA